MRTFLPPKEELTSRGSEQTSVEDIASYFDSELSPELKKRRQKAAMLSLLPGLGQLYNGEIGKGSLFLAISLSNIVLFVSFVFSTPAVQALNQVAVAMQRQPNWDLARPFQSLTSSAPALIIYIALVIAFVAYAMRDAKDRALEIARENQKPARFVLELPEATSGSYLVHLTFMIAMLLTVFLFIAPELPKQQITNIELIQPEPPKPPDPPKPKVPDPPKPKPVVLERPKPKPMTPKIEPPKPTPVAVAVPTKDPTPLTTDQSAPVPEPSPPAPQTGPAGGGSPESGGGGGGEEIDLGPYMAELQRRIKKNWFPPKGNETKRVVVFFHIKKNGSLRGDVDLVKSSGVSMADDAATEAVQNASPFPPLPAGAGDEIDIKFTFDYNVFGGKRTPHQW